ncbi:DUF2254 domain-containing protein [Alkalibacter rhizosphaerae]|uniref:DUF2254 domain-containing protein n=1 Tax=Alkalibacter rhizosphaerae TaxID=2815577 RepID=A0A975AI05_9FIRM|nr:DUF2254 domain-containing protein [Alkalibacter rhizosphaerae]QSX08573.1 DUF2254 domain-containing protein [Alkalibacter rhizosphaerae]
MIQKIRVLYENNKVWLFLSKYLFFSLLLAMLILLIDSRILPLIQYIPGFFLTGIDLAKTILGTLAGALLTITTFTFSTIMVVLTTYSSNFSPRVVENFLTDRISMKVLGIFTGGFFYCITTLLFMRTTVQNQLVLSATVAVVYSIVCIAYFILFVFSVSSSIQASKLITRLFLESMELIEETLEFRDKHETTSYFSTESYPSHYTVHTSEYGYLELINFHSMLEMISEVDCTIVIHTKIGTFVSENMPLFSVYYWNQETLPNKLDKRIENCFTFANEKMVISDYTFTVQKIVEIALRAISPGINDPNTAIHCIRFIGVLMARISESEGMYSVLHKEESPGRIVYEEFHLPHALFDTYQQIVHYGKSDLSVINAVFESLKTILRSCSPANGKHVQIFSSYVFDKVSDFHKHPYDQKRLENHLYDIQVLANLKRVEERGKNESN